jgi:hypothetical protein
MEVVSNGGGKGIQSNRLLTWTIGEPFVTTLNGAGYKVTQGFQQPKPCSNTFVSATDLADWGLQVFPNPTEGWLTVRYSTEKNGRLVANVFDLLGRPVVSNQVIASPEGSEIDATAWPAGVYVLHLLDPATKAFSTVRIVRL